MLRTILQWLWGIVVIATAVLTFPVAVEEGVTAWGRWGQFAVIYLYPYLGPSGMLIPFVLGVFWWLLYYPPALFKRLSSGSDNRSGFVSPTAVESEFQEENIHEDVMEVIRQAKNKEDSSRIFYAYMERDFRPDEKDAVAAYMCEEHDQRSGRGRFAIRG